MTWTLLFCIAQGMLDVCIGVLLLLLLITDGYQGRR